LRQAGVIRVYDTNEILDAARVFAFCKPIENRRVAILTNGGGWGIIASDFIESTGRGIGAKLAVLSEETKAKIAPKALAFASLRNPIDLTASLNNEMCDVTLEALQDDPGVDIILCTLGYQPPAVTEELTDIIIRWAKTGKKPIIVVPVGSDIVVKAMQRFNEAGVPAYASIWRGVQAIDYLARRGDYLINLWAWQLAMENQCLPIYPPWVKDKNINLWFTAESERTGFWAFDVPDRELIGQFPPERVSIVKEIEVCPVIFNKSRYRANCTLYRVAPLSVNHR